MRKTRGAAGFSNNLIIYLPSLLNVQPNYSGLSSGGCATIGDAQRLTIR